MKLRYYLRGLGIGMIVTALLMGIALKDERPLSDAEIRLRAMELGMIDGDSRTLAGSQASQDSGKEPPESTVPSSEPTTTPSSEPTTVPIVTPIPIETLPSGTESDSSKPLPMVTLKPQAETPEPTDAVSGSTPESASASASESSESITFVIQRGQSSYGVAKALMEVGLIEDASAFDQYLENNGYSKRINSGTYEIPVDSTAEEIAKIITRSR